MRKHISRLGAAVLLAACSGAIGAGEVAPQSLPSAARDLLMVYPGAQVHTEQERVRIIYGVPMAGGITPRDSAMDWLKDNALAFGCGDLELVEEWSTPVMEGRFTVFGYRQFINGVPVELGMARVLVLNGQGNQVVYAAGNLAPRPPQGFPPVVLDGGAAQQIAAGHQDSAALKNWKPAELAVFQGDGDWVTPVLTWKVSGIGEADNARTFFVDAATGEVVYVRNDISYIDVSGSVKGWASSGTNPDASYNLPALLEVPEIRVSISFGGSAVAGRDGQFVIANAVSSPVTVNAGVNASGGGGGPWVNVFPVGQTPVSASQGVTPPGPASLVLNAAPAAIVTAQVNTFIGTTVTHNYFKDRAPGFTGLDMAILARTGVSGTCNAFFSPGDLSINFYNAGGGCPNTAYSSVISHEYGHFIVNQLGLSQNAFGEGYGDVTAMLVWNDDRLGRGWTGQNTWLRYPVGANIQYPCASGQCSGLAIHCCGQMLGGVWWRMRDSFGTALGSAPGLEYTRSLAVAWSLITTGGVSSSNPAGPSTAIQVLTIDDNDGNISNGTPNFSRICTVFSAHNIPCPTLPPITFSYPDGRPALVAAGAPVTIAVNVGGGTSVPQAGSGLMSYRIGTGGAFTTQAMTEVQPNQYEATFPPMDCGQTLQYYFSASNISAQAFTDPPAAPASFFSASPLLNAATTPVAELTFNTDPGWTVTNTSVSTGAWQRAVPHTPASSNCPSTDADQSGTCWVTDNRSGNFDLDGGPTVLTTSAFDLSAYADAVITYARWFLSVNGTTDQLRVEVSNDNGGSWHTVEVVPHTSSGWVNSSFRVGAFVPVSSQVRVRFIANDNPNDSVTEAGIDWFRVAGYTCAPSGCYPNCDGSMSAPILNVQDFTCFLQKFASGDDYANCDGSTSAPVLNVSDFTCFLQSFAAGCP